MTVSHLTRSRDQLWSDLLVALGGSEAFLSRSISERRILLEIMETFSVTVSTKDIDDLDELLEQVVIAAGGTASHLRQNKHEMLAALVTALGGTSPAANSSSTGELLAAAVNAAAESGGGGDVDVLVPVVWSATDHRSWLTISSDGATATRNNAAGGTWASAKSDTSQSSGIHYVEVTVTVGETSGNNFMLFGVANGLEDVIGTSSGIGAAAGSNSAAYWSIGATLFNGGFSSHEPPGTPAYGDGDVLGMVVDLDAHTVKWNKNGGTYGTTQDITALGANIYVACSINDTSTPFNVIRLNGY